VLRSASKSPVIKLPMYLKTYSYVAYGLFKLGVPHDEVKNYRVVGLPVLGNLKPCLNPPVVGLPVVSTARQQISSVELVENT
jgi:hypothetical protein